MPLHKFLIAYRPEEDYNKRFLIKTHQDWHSEVMDALFDNDYKTNGCSIAAWVEEVKNNFTNCHIIDSEESMVEFQIFLHNKNKEQ